MLLNAAKLRQVMPSVTEADVWVDCLLPAMTRFDVNTKARLAAFLAQLAHESGEFQRLVENLNYSAAGLHKTFKTRFPTLADAQPFAHQPEKIANLVYANRLGNGNTASGDGWRFRGRGLIQTTGRTNYHDTGHGIDVDLVADPNLLAVDKHTAALAAGFFWRSHGLNALADSGDPEDFARITRKINGGLNGQPQRVAFWQRAKAAL